MAKANRESHKYVMFLGRWSPFHEGHKELIERAALRKGKKALILVRDTPRDEDNPWSFNSRKTRIEHSLKEWRGQFKIRKVEDIEEIAYGRKVGYAVKEYKLPKRFEEISGTKTREQMRKQGKL